MSILCGKIGNREDCDSGGLLSVSRFGTFVLEEMDRQGISLTELERRTDISDSTLSRILRAPTQEPKPSQVARIAKGLGMKFWVLMRHAGYTDEIPDDADDETRRIAAVITGHPVLREIMREAELLTVEERDAALAYMAVVRQQRARNRRKARQRRKSQSAPEAE